MNRHIRIFADRHDAGDQLAQELKRRDYQHPIILGIPRGGVVVSSVIARALGADHGIVVARKLGAPDEPELAIVAVSSTGVAYLNQEVVEDVGADQQYIAREIAAQIERAKRYEEQFDSRRRPVVAGRQVIIVDDGVATGATAGAAIRAMKAAGAARVICAVPVAPPHTVALLHREADEVVCLIEDPLFFAVGQFYRDFRAIEDHEVKTIMDSVATAATSAPTEPVEQTEQPH